MKKRKAKYNPNKVINLINREAQKDYELWMKFDVIEVENAHEQFIKKGLKKSTAIAGFYELHDGDLVVPLCNHLSVDSYNFFVGVDSYYYHENDATNIKEDPRQFTLPTMSWDEFKNGGNSELKITDSGIKRRWMGFGDELEEIKKAFLKQGYVQFRSIAYIKAVVNFKSVGAYTRFKSERVLRSKYRQDYLNGLGKVA